MLRLATVCLILLGCQASVSAKSSLKESVPAGVTPKAEQKAVVDALAARVSRCDAAYDQDGNLISLLLCNHNAFSRIKPQTRSGVDDATFRRLNVVPSLKQLHLLKQPLSDDAFAILRQWPDLEVFCIEGHKGDHSGRFMLHLNGHPNLKWLELKHLFGLDGTAVDQLDAFPKLERLELDNASATARCLPFLKRNPQLRDFELHRSTMTNEEIAALVDALPRLERLALKPLGKKCFDHRCLKEVTGLTELKVFGFHHWKEKLFVWHDGIEHLAELPELAYVECPSAFWESEAMLRLRAKKPHLQNTGKHIIAEFANEPPR